MPDSSEPLVPSEEGRRRTEPGAAHHQDLGEATCIESLQDKLTPQATLIGAAGVFAIVVTLVTLLLRHWQAATGKPWYDYPEYWSSGNFSYDCPHFLTSGTSFLNAAQFDVSKASDDNLSEGPVVIVSAQFGYKDKVSDLPDLPEDLTGFFYTEDGTLVSAGRGWTVVRRKYFLEPEFSCADTDPPVVAGANGTNCTVGRLRDIDGTCAGRYDSATFHAISMCCACGGGNHNPFDAQSSFSLSTMRNLSLAGVMSARFVKLNAFRLPELKEAGTVMWLDAAKLQQLKHFEFRDPLARSARLVLGQHDMVVQHHETRDKVQDEIEPASKRAAITQGVSRNETLRQIHKGVAVMKNLGFSDDVGLFNTAEFLIDPKSKAVDKLMLDWWLFLQRYTFRDQISFPFMLSHSRVDYLTACCGLGCLVPTLHELATGGREISWPNWAKL